MVRKVLIHEPMFTRDEGAEMKRKQIMKPTR